jgi:cytidylate kinase
MIICIVGPTGVGKSKLALRVAKKLNGEIVNGDAFQIYKEMDIGTAKPTLEERTGGDERKANSENLLYSKESTTIFIDAGHNMSTKGKESPNLENENEMFKGNDIDYDVLHPYDVSGNTVNIYRE